MEGIIMQIMEVGKDMITEIFDLKENVKKSVYAVMEGRLTAGHLIADLSVLLEKLDKLEVILIGEPLVEEVTPSPQPPAEEQPSVQEEQPQTAETAEQPEEKSTDEGKES